jgi:hypothetical protein
MNTPRVDFDHEKLDHVREGKAVLHETVCLLVGLIKSRSPERLGEEPLPDRTSGEV